MVEGVQGVRRCEDCACRLAGDNPDTRCSPCRRSGLLATAGAPAPVGGCLSLSRPYQELGIEGLATELGVDLEEALEVAFDHAFVSPRLRSVKPLLLRLLELDGLDHTAAGVAVGRSRWTVMDWRHQLHCGSRRLPGGTRP